MHRYRIGLIYHLSISYRFSLSFIYIVSKSILILSTPIHPSTHPCTQESFSGDGPCAGLADLLSKTTISSNATPNPDANANPKSNSNGPPSDTHPAHATTPGFQTRGVGLGGGAAGDGGGGGGSGSAYSARMGEGGDRSFSFGDETPRTPRDNAAYARGVPDSGQMWEDWRRVGEEGSGADDPGRAVDFSTPATVDRRRGARGGAGDGAGGGRARGRGDGADRFDALVGASSLGLDASDSHG